MASVHREMLSIAKTLPEYPAVLSINGIGETLGSQLMAEIGDIRRFSKRSNITAFAGVDAPPFQSGKFDSKTGGYPNADPVSFVSNFFRLYVSSCNSTCSTIRYINSSCAKRLKESLIMYIW